MKLRAYTGWMAMVVGIIAITSQVISVNSLANWVFHLLPPSIDEHTYYVIYAEEGRLRTKGSADEDGSVPAAINLDEIHGRVLWFKDQPQPESGEIGLLYFLWFVWPNIYKVAPNAVMDVYVAPEELGNGSNDGFFLTLESKPLVLQGRRAYFAEATLRNWTTRDPLQEDMILSKLKLTILPHSPDEGETRWSFSMAASRLSFASAETPGEYTLRLEEAQPEMHYVSHAPSRSGYDLEVKTFVDNWGKRFASGAANALLTSFSLGDEAGEGVEIHPHWLSLSNPGYSETGSGDLDITLMATLFHGSVDPSQDLHSSLLLIESATEPRTITLVNRCNIDIWAAAAGNIGTRKCENNNDCGGADCINGSCKKVACANNSECPVNQYCATNIPSKSTFCTQDDQCNQAIKESCDTSATGYMPDPFDACTNDPDYCTRTYPGENLFCDTSEEGRGRCGFHQCTSYQCYNVPVPVTTPTGAASCKSNTDCQTDEICYAVTGVASTRSGNCSPVPSIANGWDLAAGGITPTSLSFPVPSPWAGRFWARTGCVDKDSEFTCDTGQCLGLDGKKFSMYCGQSGLPPITLAELFLPDFDGTASDFYDVSMVDGSNVPVQIAPEANTYNVGVDNANAVGGTCNTDGDCNADGKFNWVCGNVDGEDRCVNKYECGSPGCFEGCEQFGCGQYLSPEKVLPGCPWSGTIFAVDENICPTGLQKHANPPTPTPTPYVGCYSAEQACANKGEQNGLECDGASRDLYRCTGLNAQSCYDENAGGDNCCDGKGKNCCGCPEWGGAECKCDNPNWHSTSAPYVQIFHDACPTAYGFPFDDKAATFTCKGQSVGNNVSYRITFCPNLREFGSELRRFYLPFVRRD